MTLLALTVIYLALLAGLGGGRLLRVLVSLDIFLFAVCTLGRSKRNETFSSAAWTTECDGKWQGKLFRPLIDWGFTWLERGHCQASWINEQH